MMSIWFLIFLFPIVRILLPPTRGKTSLLSIAGWVYQSRKTWDFLGITVPNSMIFDLVPLASIYRKILLSN
ncbi:hypothetical protein AAHE18_19G133100 [Arachis hypogaea]